MYDVRRIGKKGGPFLGKTVAESLVDIHAAMSLMRSFGNGYCVVNGVTGLVMGVCANGILRPQDNFRFRANAYNDEVKLRRMNERKHCGSMGAA